MSSFANPWIDVKSDSVEYTPQGQYSPDRGDDDSLSIKYREDDGWDGGVSTRDEDHDGTDEVHVTVGTPHAEFDYGTETPVRDAAELILGGPILFMNHHVLKDAVFEPLSDHFGGTAQGELSEGGLAGFEAFKQQRQAADGQQALAKAMGAGSLAKAMALKAAGTTLSKQTQQAAPFEGLYDGAPTPAAPAPTKKPAARRRPARGRRRR